MPEMRDELSDEAIPGQCLAPLAFYKPELPKQDLTARTETRLKTVGFNVFKFNSRPRPKSLDRIKIISCFSEFGCEILGCMYCVPRLIKRFPGQYIIAMGWHGRDYLYRHLVDEFWELQEEYMWLRDYSRGFHHLSHNLKKIEYQAAHHGHVIPSAALGKYAVANFCRTCGKFWHEWRKQQECCPCCKSTVLVRSLFTDINHQKPMAKRIPKPRLSVLEWAKSFLPQNTVGIFARGRKTYGRNLQPEFYVKLIRTLQKMGYNVIWLGEKQSTQPCPVSDVLDFTKMVESRDLEKTLAIVCHLQFTIQFWTASTRLAGMVGVPFLLFESPEQICASYSGILPAQEGKRLELCSFGPKKLVLSHFWNVYDDNERCLELVQQAVREMQQGNYETIVGQVQDEEFTALLRNEHLELLT